MPSNKTSRGGGATASPCARLRDAYHDCFNRYISFPPPHVLVKGRDVETEIPRRVCSFFFRLFLAVVVTDAKRLPSFIWRGDRRWYSEKFSKGQWDKEECVAEWDKYRACLAQHLEDKHLRRILLEAEASPYFVKDDASSPADRDGTTHQ
ncbi:Uncharacterized protein family (UPF0203) [Musa troglodytarum]|uniref:Uncharacterized protein family (UPF0203) n=1 Tax=Musa troglodytarum TaxID=320322 RepID=A0A9E7FDV7_9LILI|nr:Uncharacterized protein family (UPF0203) [Musa troglodytarum]